MTIQIGNVTLGLIVLLLIVKLVFVASLPWAIVFAPLWISFALWGICAAVIVAWFILLGITRLICNLLTAIFN